MHSRSLALLATLSLWPAQAAFAADYPTSFWVEPDKGWVVETRPCDGGLCAYLIGFRIDAAEPPGFVARDVKNPDPARRRTPICGLMLMGGFNPSPRADGKWIGGWVYDPESGDTYSGIITVVDADTVRLRGYVGLPLFGRTLTLHRETGPTIRCEKPDEG